MKQSTVRPWPTRANKLDEFMRAATAQCVLKSPAELADNVSLPPALFSAMLSGRPELIKLADPRPLSAAECRDIYQLIGTLIQTNMILRDHAETLGKLVHDWADLFKGINRLGIEIENFAAFKPCGLGDETE